MIAQAELTNFFVPLVTSSVVMFNKEAAVFQSCTRFEQTKPEILKRKFTYENDTRRKEGIYFIAPGIKAKLT